MEFAKGYLHDDLKRVRGAVVGKLDGLTEYNIRRPLTATGTNFLGLVNHLSVWEAVYLGQIFDRPFPEARDYHDDFLVPEGEASVDVIARFQRVCAHSDETIRSLDLDTAGHVAWWPRPDVKLFNILVHLIAETNRHAGHMDILREQLDGRTGFGADDEHLIGGDAEFWSARVAEIENAAKAAASRHEQR